MPLQVRRGQTADRLLITPVIGELIYDTIEKTLYIGDGTTPGGVAASSFTFEDAQDAASGLLTSGIHSNISFSYNDTANRIDASLDLTNYSGIIEADGFKGSVFANDSSLLIDGVLGSFQLDGTVRTNVVPFTDETYDLGSPTNKFRDLYLSGSSLFLGDAQITATGSAVNLPAGSTVDGVLIGSGPGDGVVDGSNYRINIVGDDSSLIVDSSARSINAPGGIFGDLSGSVFGIDSSVLVDAVNNEIRGDVIGNFNGSLSGNLDTGNFGIFSQDNVFIVPQNYAQFGTSAGINGNIVITRNSYTAGILDGLGGFLFEQYHENILADRMNFYRSRGSSDTPSEIEPFDVLGEITFSGNTNVPPFSQVSASIRGSVDGSIVGNTAPGRIEFYTNNGVSGFTRKARLTTNGIWQVDQISGLTSSLVVTGNLVGDVTGSLFSDDSTRIIDGTEGSITAQSFVQFGSLTTTERNSLSAANGMVIYNTTNNRFEGYQNGSWINLDDGTAAGV